jgi:hypothetical protein
MALRFEIYPMEHLNGLWRIREGDIEGSVELSNQTQKEVLTFIKEKMQNLRPFNLLRQKRR